MYSQASYCFLRMKEYWFGNTAGATSQRCGPDRFSIISTIANTYRIIMHVIIADICSLKCITMRIATMSSIAVKT